MPITEQKSSSEDTDVIRCEAKNLCWVLEEHFITTVNQFELDNMAEKKWCDVKYELGKNVKDKEVKRHI